MARYKITLAYDGTHFYGMQRQAQERTVQADLEDALRKLGWAQQSLQFAGRTDRGVHAAGQVAAFDLDWNHSLGDLREALNANLAQDLAVQDAQEVSADFHPRYGARQRSYAYRLIFAQARQPLKERYAWRLWPPLELEQMNALSRPLIGLRDFAALGTPQKEGGSTLREVFTARWQGSHEEMIFEISANAFLYHMVRRTLGLLVRLGREGKSADELEAILEKQELVQDLAPAKGLSLMKIDYKE